jgi:hypothetical protein
LSRGDNPAAIDAAACNSTTPRDADSACNNTARDADSDPFELFFEQLCVHWRVRSLSESWQFSRNFRLSVRRQFRGCAWVRPIWCSEINGLFWYSEPNVASAGQSCCPRWAASFFCRPTIKHYDSGEPVSAHRSNTIAIATPISGVVTAGLVIAMIIDLRAKQKAKQGEAETEEFTMCFGEFNLGDQIEADNPIASDDNADGGETGSDLADLA